MQEVRTSIIESKEFFDEFCKEGRGVCIKEKPPQSSKKGWTSIMFGLAEISTHAPIMP
ncbi:MAG: hypothetical protein ACI92I_000524 [Acidimicrobiales bacterium]|jgi:hypothetical protein